MISQKQPFSIIGPIEYIWIRVFANLVYNIVWTGIISSANIRSAKRTVVNFANDNLRHNRGVLNSYSNFQTNVIFTLCLTFLSINISHTTLFSSTCIHMCRRTTVTEIMSSVVRCQNAIWLTNVSYVETRLFNYNTNEHVVHYCTCNNTCTLCFCNDLRRRSVNVIVNVKVFCRFDFNQFRQDPFSKNWGLSKCSIFARVFSAAGPDS